MNVVDDLHRLLTGSIGQAPLIEVDLAAVTFIDSTMISTLTAAHHGPATAGSRLSVTHPSGHVHRVLTMTGVLTALGD